MTLTKLCIDCKISKSTEDFYNQKDHSYGKMSYCKKCFNVRCQKRWVNRKINAINYKGGKCEDCSLELSNSHYAVFEFHHLDPSAKDHDWSTLRLQSLHTIELELDKCALLCANCHRIRHVKIEDFPEQVKSHQILLNDGSY